MLDQAVLALTVRLVRRRIAGSPAAIAAGLLFPVFVVWIGISQSYDTAARFFFFLLPHVFLVGAPDTVRTDVEGGALESVLFLGGRFREYLLARSLVLAAAAAGYGAVLFILLAGWGLAIGAYEPVFAVRFALAIMAGLYYAALGGVLSHVLRNGSNVLALLLAQSAAVTGLLFSTTARSGLLDYAAMGHFPGPGPKLLFGGLVAVLPNVIVSGRLPAFAAEVLIGLGLAVFVRVRLVRRLELRR